MHSLHQKRIHNQKVVLLGFGSIGQAFVLRSLASRETLADRHGLSLSFVSLRDSTGAVTCMNGFDDDGLRSLLSVKARNCSLDGISGEEFRLPTSERLVIVDATNTPATIPLLLEAKRMGHGIVLCNKHPLSTNINTYCALAVHGTEWSTTVGSATPIVSALKSLLANGDEIESIEATLSGTLERLALLLERNTSFSEAVRRLVAEGHTEADPRADLSGEDVRRKMVILSRMMGIRITLDDITGESLYPPELDRVPLDQFMAVLPDLDGSVAARVAEAAAGQTRLHYVSWITELPAAFSQWSGMAPATRIGSSPRGNITAVFGTQLFGEAMLTVSGAGSGRELTAGGILGNVVRLSREFRFLDCG